MGCTGGPRVAGQSGGSTVPGPTGRVNLAGPEGRVSLAGSKWRVNLAGPQGRVNLAGPFSGCVKGKSKGSIQGKAKQRKRVNVHLLFWRPVISHHVDIVCKSIISLSYSAYIFQVLQWIYCELLM